MAMHSPYIQSMLKDGNYFGYDLNRAQGNSIWKDVGGVLFSGMPHVKLEPMLRFPWLRRFPWDILEEINAPPTTATAVTTLATDIIQLTATVDILPTATMDILDMVRITATEDTGLTTTTGTTMAMAMVATVTAMETMGTAMGTMAMGAMVILLMVVTTDIFLFEIKHV